jgi:purine nucleosidase
VLLHPELVTAAGDYAVDVETGSELTRGYSAMSWGVHGLTPNARVVEAVDADGFAAYLSSLLSLRVEPTVPIVGL